MTEKLPVVARLSRRTRPLLVAWLWSREKGESRLPLGQRLSWRARSLTHTALSLASSKPLPQSSLDYQTLSVCFTLRPNSGAEGSRFGMWRNPATRSRTPGVLGGRLPPSPPRQPRAPRLRGTPGTSRVGTNPSCFPQVRLLARWGPREGSRFARPRLPIADRRRLALHIRGTRA